MAQQRLRAATSHITVKHELLVRYLDAWTPTVLHAGRRVTYAEAYAGAGMEPRHPDGSPGAALRVFGEFIDRLSGHELAMVLLDEDPSIVEELARRLAAGHAELGSPPELIVRAAHGSCVDDLLPTLTAADALSGPMLTYLDAAGANAPPPPYEVIAAVGRHKSNEVLLTVDPMLLQRLAAGEEPAELGDRLFGSTAWRRVTEAPAARRYAGLVTDYRESLRRAGLGAVVHVEMVDRGGDTQLLFFATRSTKSLERFKTELWAVDEYAGVRYRDPRDDEHELLDISDRPSLGPLRRALVTAVATHGVRTVAELRQYALTETLYSAADATRALGALVTGGALAREPEKGRLAADTVLRSA